MTSTVSLKTFVWHDPLVSFNLQAFCYCHSQSNSNTHHYLLQFTDIHIINVNRLEKKHSCRADLTFSSLSHTPTTTTTTIK